MTIGPAESISQATTLASRMQWIGDTPSAPFRASARIRYNHEAASATIEPLAGDRVQVCFDEPQWAVTPGQALVIYRDDEVLGGGWID